MGQAWGISTYDKVGKFGGTTTVIPHTVAKKERTPDALAKYDYCPVCHRPMSRHKHKLAMIGFTADGEASYAHPSCVDVAVWNHERELAHEHAGK